MSGNEHVQGPLGEGDGQAAVEKPSLSVRRRIRVWELFFAGLAGFDPRLVYRYAGPEAEHELKRLLRIGIGVTIPAFMSLFTVFFFLGPYVEVVPTRIVFSIMAALFVLVLDSILVTTLTRNGGWGTLVRIGISVCLGWVIAEPLLISLYEKTIDSQIVRRLDAEKAAKQMAYGADLDQVRRDYGRLDEQLKADQVQLEGYTAGAVAARHLKELEERKAGMLQQVQSQREQDLAGLNREKSVLERQRNRIQQDIEAKIVEMQNERAGKRASGKSGEGGVYRSLGAALKALQEELEKVNKQIASVDERVSARGNDMTQEYQAGTQLSAFAANNAVFDAGTLTPEERTEKQRLDAEMEGLTVALNSNRSRQQQIATAIAALEQEFAPANQTDSLAQARALYEVLQTNWYLRARVTALFLLLFLIDLAPVIIKMTVRTGYEDYVKSLAGERHKKMAAARDACHASAISYGKKKIERLNDLRKTATEGLADCDPEGINSGRIRSVTHKAGRAVERQLEESLNEAEYTQVEAKQPGGLQDCWWALKRWWWWWQGGSGGSGS